MSFKMTPEQLDYIRRKSEETSKIEGIKGYDEEKFIKEKDVIFSKPKETK